MKNIFCKFSSAVLALIMLISVCSVLSLDVFALNASDYGDFGGTVYYVDNDVPRRRSLADYEPQRVRRIRYTKIQDTRRASHGMPDRYKIGGEVSCSASCISYLVSCI